MKHRFLFSLICSTLLPIYAYARVDFVIINNDLNLIGPRAEIELECHAVVQYSKFIRQRNNLAPIQDTCAQILSITEIDRLNFSVPLYGDTYDSSLVAKNIENTDSVKVDISNILPRDIWEKYKPVQQDTICYNNALVESGILSFDDRSAYLENMSYFLGMNIAQDVRETNELYEIHYGPMSNSPFVMFRKAFYYRYSPDTVQSFENDLKTTIRDQFSPGSIMCLEPGKFKSVNELENMEKEIAEQIGKNVISNRMTLKSDFYLENKGGHCFVFITPNLVTESNGFSPHNLVNFDIALKGYEDNEFRWEGSTFFYFRTNNANILNRKWINNKFYNKFDPNLRSVLKLHRTFFENIDISTCNIYTAYCLGKHPDLKLSVLNFWHNTVSPVLKLKRFSLFANAREKNNFKFMGGMTRVNYDVYARLSETYDLIVSF